MILGYLSSPGEEVHAEIYFQPKDRHLLIELISSLYGEHFTFNSFDLHLPLVEPRPFQFVKLPKFQFVYVPLTDIKTNKLYKLLEFTTNCYQKLVEGGGQPHEWITKELYLSSDLLKPEPKKITELSSIKELDRVERLLKEADLQLSSEQEVILLRRIVQEQQEIINSLRGK